MKKISLNKKYESKSNMKINDSYVHRLIQNQTDGKIVEIPEPRPDKDLNSTRSKLLEAKYNSKIDSVIQE
jgi:hypothetical protein